MMALSVMLSVALVLFSIASPSTASFFDAPLPSSSLIQVASSARLEVGKCDLIFASDGPPVGSCCNNMRCPFDNGVCCKDGVSCCPQGSTCLKRAVGGTVTCGAYRVPLPNLPNACVCPNAPPLPAPTSCGQDDPCAPPPPPKCECEMPNVLAEDPCKWGNCKVVDYVEPEIRVASNDDVVVPPVIPKAIYLPGASPCLSNVC